MPKYAVCEYHTAAVAALSHLKDRKSSTRYSTTVNDSPPTGSPSCLSTVASVAAITRHGVKNAATPTAPSGLVRVAPPVEPIVLFDNVTRGDDRGLSPR